MMAEASRKSLGTANDCGYGYDGGRDSLHQPFLKTERVLYGPPATYHQGKRSRVIGTLSRFPAFSLAALITVTYIIYTFPASTFLGFASDVITTGTSTLSLPHPGWPHNEHPVEFWENIAISYPKAERAKEWSRYYTSGPHLGGLNYSQALWTQQRFEEFGFETKIEAYEMYVNYPLGHRLALLETGKHGFKVKYEAKLEEPVLEKDTTSGLKDRIPTFHGYSASGNVTGPLVFANYGTFTDFETLLAHNVTITGSVVIAKYGGIFRGLKVRRAQELGAVGVILYSDPGDDWDITPENGYQEYPEGPARHHQSVQRGSTQFLSLLPGDPTTPGFPSKPGCPRQDPYHFIPRIPSIPISYDDAVPLLRALNSHGPLATDIGWSPGGLEYKNVKYNIGPTPPHLSINLVNEQNYTITPMWNVIATIPGTLGSSDGIVIAGNHRDAWIAGGAGDPNSGSAALLEVAGALAEMRKQGWKPIRDIILASWDGEEYALLGSTEWVEDHAKYLSENAIAYINLDVGSTGSYFETSANPLLFDFIREAAAKVPIGDPTEGRTIANSGWSGHISTLGSGSDYTAFQDFLGIPSTDMGFTGGRDNAVWMYHSNYDSFSWMEMFGDKGFVYHEAIARLWGVMLVRLSTSDILPLNVTRYAEDLEGYLGQIKYSDGQTLKDFSATGVNEAWLSASSVGGSGQGLDVYGNPTKFAYSRHNELPEDKDKDKDRFDLSPLPAVFSKLMHDALRFTDSVDNLKSTILDSLTKEPTAWNYIPRLVLWWKVTAANKVMRKFDRAWVDQEGLSGRDWFKHVVYAPGRWTGYAGAVFPALGESWEDSDVGAWEKGKKAIAAAGERARHVLRGC